MNIKTTLLLLFTCFALVTGNIANAASMCCCADSTSFQTQTQMDISIDMPCHDMATQSPEHTSDNMACDNCGCTHGMTIASLWLPAPLKDTIQLHGAPIMTEQNFYTYQPAGLLQPPQSIS